MSLKIKSFNSNKSVEFPCKLKVYGSVENLDKFKSNILNSDNLQMPFLIYKIHQECDSSNYNEDLFENFTISKERFNKVLTDTLQIEVETLFICDFKMTEANGSVIFSFNMLNLPIHFISKMSDDFKDLNFLFEYKINEPETKVVVGFKNGYLMSLVRDVRCPECNEEVMVWPPTYLYNSHPCKNLPGIFLNNPNLHFPELPADDSTYFKTSIDLSALPPKASEKASIILNKEVQSTGL